MRAKRRTNCRQRIGGRFEEGFGQARRQRRAQGVAIARGVFHGDEAGFAARCGRARTRRVCASSVIVSRDLRRGRSRCDFVLSQIAQLEQKIVQAVGVAGLIVGIERLKLRFHFVHGRLVEQFAEIGAAQNLFELRLIDGERLRATLGQRRIAFVDVVGDVGEQQRGRERRRLGRSRRW